MIQLIKMGLGFKNFFVFEVELNNISNFCMLQ